MPAANVIDETLRRVTTAPVPDTPTALRDAVEAPPPAPTLSAVAAPPLAAWVEDTFGLRTEDEGLVRREPVTFVDGLKRLVEQTSLDPALCDERLKAVLDAGSGARTTTDDPVLAFRLHQSTSAT